jgi:long-chain acyl-CoA synthetase
MTGQASNVILASPPAATPVMSLAEADARLIVPGSRFEIGEAMIRGHKLKVWTQIPPTLDVLFDKARIFGSREFLVYEDERVTYDAFIRASIRLAQKLADKGVVKGDRVAIVMRNLPEWAVAFYAGMLTGAIVTPLNGWWTADELIFGLNDSGSRIAIVDDERYDRILPHLNDCPALEHLIVARTNSLPADPRLERLEDLIGRPNDWANLPDAPTPKLDALPDDDVTIFYTSGTTGRSKGALGTHRNILSNLAAIAYGGMRTMLRYGLPLPTETDPLKIPQRVNLLAVPLFHATGLTTQLVLGLSSGMKVVMMRRWNAEQAAELIERERVNATGGVPTIAWQLVEQAALAGRDLSSLSSVTYGGAPAAPELTRRIKERFPKAQVATGWGMTETMAAFTAVMGVEYENHPSSAGPAVPVGDMQVRDPDDGVTILPRDTVGELWVQGPQVVRLYWNRPEATAETFVDGWLRTGDLARIDEEGFLYIVDRAKDMLIRGGENIYCLEVENALYEHPDVMDAAVVGLPHRTLGEEPAAVVHLRPGGTVTETELRDLVRSRLASFKTPVRVAFWPETLPRNANGKVLKRDLKEALIKAFGVETNG